MKIKQYTATEERTFTCERCTQVVVYLHKGGRQRRVCESCYAGKASWSSSGNESHQQLIDRERRSWLMRQFGITLEYYNELLEAQSGCCALCKLPEKVKTRNGQVRRLAVDHDHKTGRIRGLLCFRCNIALGHLEELSKEEDTLEFLQRYLEICTPTSHLRTVVPISSIERRDFS